MVILEDFMPRLIAIRAFNAPHLSNNVIKYTAGILASLTNEDGDDIIVTDGKWRCSAVLEPGWERVKFRESSDNWSDAATIAQHGQGPWSNIRKYIGSISHEAMWIWNRESKSETVYCRRRVTHLEYSDQGEYKP